MCTVNRYVVSICQCAGLLCDEMMKNLLSGVGVGNGSAL